MREQTPVRVCIRGGRVVDPLNRIDAVTDVVLSDGRVESVGPCAEVGVPTISAAGKLVVPGIIDMHAHIYRGLSSYGVDPDRAGVYTGVAHVNDTGSVGWMTFGGFRELIVKTAQTPVTCFPNMLSMGMPDNWALGATDFVNEKYYPELLAEHAAKHPQIMRGVKVFVERGFISNLDETWKAFNAARRVTELVPINLYVHLGDLFPKKRDARLADLDELVMETVERMRPGEIVGHCFTQYPGGMVDEHGRVHPAARLATENGVLHEVGHGLNFSFERGRRFLDAGLPVDIISSDVHGRMHAGKPRGNHGLDPDIDASTLDWSMMSTMSKCLALGMSLTDVIRASTITPAKALGIADKKGSLTVGYQASISILDLVPGRFRLFDSIGELMRAEYLFLPVSTIIGRDLWRCDPLSMPEFQNDYVANNPEAFGAAQSVASQ